MKWVEQICQCCQSCQTHFDKLPNLLFLEPCRHAQIHAYQQYRYNQSRYVGSLPAHECHIFTPLVIMVNSH